MKKASAIFFASLLVLSLVSPARANVDSTAEHNKVQITTDNPELNAKVARGEAIIRVHEPPSEEKKELIDKRLVELGYPEEFISTKPWGLKEILADLEIEYTEPVNHDASSPNASDVSINNLTSDGWMDAYMSGTKIQSSTNTYYKLSTYWYWNEMPTFFLTDKIGWAWTADTLFALSNEDNINTQTYSGCRLLPHGGYDPTDCTSIDIVLNSTQEYKAGEGVGMAIDIVSNFVVDGKRYKTEQAYGVAQIKVQTAYNRTGQLGTFTSVSQYFHRQPACYNFSLVYTKNPSVGVQCWLGYDTTDALTFTGTYEK